MSNTTARNPGLTRLHSCLGRFALPKRVQSELISVCLTLYLFHTLVTISDITDNELESARWVSREYVQDALKLRTTLSRHETSKFDMAEDGKPRQSAADLPDVSSGSTAWSSRSSLHA